jgi:hypothetical protein
MRGVLSNIYAIKELFSYFEIVHIILYLHEVLISLLSYH